MAIPLAAQYFVERDRNYKFLFLMVMVTILLPIMHGFLFLWLPWILRDKRSEQGLRYKPYFTFIKYFNTLTQTFSIKIWRKTFYYQPSLLLVAAFHIGINSWFAVAETRDIDYETWYYIVSKRVGRLSIAHLPIILIMVAKNNVVAALSGLSLDKTVFFHKWYGRAMFLTAIIHLVLSLKYWLDMNFYIMVEIPPQIFGFIAFSCLGMLNVASLRFIRNFAFEFFLAQHRTFNFVMLLLAYFHNGGNHAAVILGVHLLVLDRIVGRVLGIIHKYKGPTKGKCDFEILDDSTVRVTIPIKISKSDPNKWFWAFVPRYGTWRAGQHVLFNCNRVAFLSYHPFTIASLPDSGNMVLVIRVKKGFTRKLHRKLTKKSLKDSESEISVTESNIEMSDRISDSIHSSDKLFSKDTKNEIEESTQQVDTLREIISNFEKPRIFNYKAGINGPFGANYQPLTKFESVVFSSAGSGASFSLPVALDLLKTLKKRNSEEDYLYRPKHTQVTIVVALKKLANLQWYDHLWPEFMPFLSSGMAHLALFVTQEQIPESSEKQSSVFNTSSEKGDVFVESTKTESTTSSIQISTSLFGCGGFSVTYGRPDLENILMTSIEKLCSPSYRKAFASVSCGPGAFNHTIKSVCQKGRMISDAPEVYCYDESFE